MKKFIDQIFLYKLISYWQSSILHPVLCFFRDVSSVELLQKYHQGIRSEIETRAAKFTDCIDLGKSMLARKHRDSAEVRSEQTAAFYTS